jgi:transposase-like protein
MHDLKALLSPGVVIKEICRKSKSSTSSIHEWKKQYTDEVKSVRSQSYHPACGHKKTGRLLRSDLSRRAHPVGRV